MAVGDRETSATLVTFEKNLATAATTDITAGDDLVATDDLTVGDDAAVTGALTVGETLGVTGVATLTGGAVIGADSSLAEGVDIATGTTTGSKIGGAAAQKLGFWGVTPVVQPSTIADAVVAHALNSTFSDTEVEAALDALGAKINALLAKLETAGILASA